MKTKRTLALLLGSLILAIPVARAAEAKLGIVNIQEILDTVDEGKKAKSQLEKAVTDRKKSLDDQQKEYKRLEDSYEKQKLVLSPSALEEKRKELETKRGDLQRAAMTAQTDMQKKEMELTGELIKKIRQVVEKIGRDGSYSLILEKNEGGVVYNKEAFDLTKQVIDEYNKTFKK
jgi:outer membrane protein